MKRVIFLVCLIIISCGNPQAPPDPVHSPDISITLEVTGLAVELSWQGVDAARFTVYRKTEGGSFAAVDEGAGGVSGYLDDSCPFNTGLSYYVAFTNPGGGISDSLVVGPVTVSFTPPAVRNVSATRHEFNDHIRITWNAGPDADEYLICRYSGRSPAGLDRTFVSPANYFNDDSALPGTPYFYRVACRIRTAESPLSTGYAEGIFGPDIDFSEPNEDADNAAPVYLIEETALLYSFYEAGAQDTDWYIFLPDLPPAGVKVVITLPPGSQLAGETVLTNRNDGKEMTLDEGKNFFTYSGSYPLLFNVAFAAVNPEQDLIGTYTVRIEEL